jgi:signal transduction histidine kinase
MVNATVSHELRNPLNSIIAKNIEKDFLYAELKTQMEGLDEACQKSHPY